MKKMQLLLIAIGLLLTACSKDLDKQTRDPSSGEDPWTDWSRNKSHAAALLVLKRIREDLLANNIHDPHIDYKGYGNVTCDPERARYRSADGTCYDLDKPYVGAAGVAFGRNIAPEFIDFQSYDKMMTPNPSLVSKVLFTRDEFKPVPFLNMLAASWIQFMNHDWLTHGKNDETRKHRIMRHDGTVETVEHTKRNTVNSSSYKKEFGKTTLNDVTHWWDGSQIYGSNYKQQAELRSFTRGKMRMITKHGRQFLPRNEKLNVRDNKQNEGYEVTGFRDNWWVGLSMLHHLFVKEHNHVADMLFQKYVKPKKRNNLWVWQERRKRARLFNDQQLDEHIFQVARLINAAVMAKIHTIEWTPAILDNKVLRRGMYTNWYGLANPNTWSSIFKNVPGINRADWLGPLRIGYTLGGIVGERRDDFGVPFSITEEFTSVYRLHSLLPENLYIRQLRGGGATRTVPLIDTRNEMSYGLVERYGLENLFYSFGKQLPGQIVLNNFPAFMQNLSIPGHGKMDLGMVDVLRDRERGVPRYNQFRRAIGLNPINSYRDFFPADIDLDQRQRNIIAKFNQVYGKDKNGQDNVEMIDLLVGTLAEEVRPDGFGFGETQFQIFILMASRRLMADRFYTENYNADYYTKAGMDWIDNQGFMNKVIIRHFPNLAPKLKGLKTAFAPWND